MTEHIFLPNVDIDALELVPKHIDWLHNWLSQTENDVESGNICSSTCLQGLISEIVLHGSPRTDWIGMMQEYLTDDSDMPIAYSESFGRRLYGFANQRLQTPIHTIHSRWWIEKLCGASVDDLQIYGELITDMIQPNGWIYNPDVSPTRIRNRMKSEYTMSMAMGIEIMREFDRLPNHINTFQATLSSLSLTAYLSSEYFRLRALESLDSQELAPVLLHEVLTECQLDIGYCDFSVESKIDDYMGSAKRTSRDEAIHSPLAALHAYHISDYCAEDVKAEVETNLEAYGNYLRSNPLDIQAFRIRDLDIPFGTDVTPLEIMAASFIADLFV